MRPKIICSIIEGAFDDTQLCTLQNDIAYVYQKRVSRNANPVVIWGETRGSHLFTEGKPSSSSVLLIEVPHSFKQAEREALMEEICKLWEKVTQTPPENTLVTVADKSYVDLYLKKCEAGCACRPSRLPH